MERSSAAARVAALVLAASFSLAAQEPLKIGFSMSLTGPLGGNGRAALDQRNSGSPLILTVMNATSNRSLCRSGSADAPSSFCGQTSTLPERNTAGGVA